MTDLEAARAATEASYQQATHDHQQAITAAEEARQIINELRESTDRLLLDITHLQMINEQDTP